MAPNEIELEQSPWLTRHVGGGPPVLVPIRQHYLGAIAQQKRNALQRNTPMNYPIAATFGLTLLALAAHITGGLRALLISNVLPPDWLSSICFGAFRG